MRFERKRLVGIGAALAIAVAGGGAAIAASGHHGSSADRGGFPGFRGGNPPAGYGFPPGGVPGGRGFGPGGDLETAAAYLGISVQTLLGNLQSGETLAQVASATAGKSSAGLADALVTAEKHRIEQAVTAGRLTRARADQVESGLQARVQAEVQGTLRGHGFGGPDGDRDRGAGPGGDGTGGGQPATPTATAPATHI